MDDKMNVKTDATNLLKNEPMSYKVSIFNTLCMSRITPISKELCQSFAARHGLDADNHEHSLLIFAKIYGQFVQHIYDEIAV